MGMAGGKWAVHIMLSCLLIAPISVYVLADVSESVQDETIVEVPDGTIQVIGGLPSLMCGDGLCPVKDRSPSNQFGLSKSEAGEWWFGLSPDRDANGMDDRLQRVLAGEYDSVSPTAIMGPDGRLTVAIVVDFPWHPTDEDRARLESTLLDHGWKPTGSDLYISPYLDRIFVDHVPLQALIAVWLMTEVVHVEQQNVMVPFNEIATQAIRAAPSTTYWATAHERGYHGDGVVVAVLDTGVDNEHRSLNDFDDIDDSPDEDAKSYNDPKWVAGYDATIPTSNTDGSADPDDSNEPSGHGTHVAGSAVGTGDSRRINGGVAPGAYLVDVKVLTDAGGTNSANSVRGLTWVLNNVDTDWNNNESSRGIDVVSMSFGSVSNPNSDDPGDNGSSGEAVIVNQISDAGAICVVAMGNDGKRRVPSPASADKAITVGMTNDRNTVTLDDDQMNSNSNFGPRENDGDDDELDELKPTVTAPGTNINSAQFAGGGTVTLPGTPGPMADDSYHELTGTSMATPVVSGMVAVMLSADETLDWEGVMELMRLHSYQFESTQPSEPTIDDTWHEKWGWGIADLTAVLDAILGEESGNGVIIPPDDNDTGDGPQWVEIIQPENGTWVLAGQRIDVGGLISPTSIDRLEIRVNNGSWTQLTVADNWSGKIRIPTDVDTGDPVFIRVRARGSGGVWSATSIRFVWANANILTLDRSQLSEEVSRTVSFDGTYDGVEVQGVQIRLDEGEWSSGGNVILNSSKVVAGLEISEGSWTWTWDSENVEDGPHRIRFRLVNDSEVVSEEVVVNLDVDNVNAPDVSVDGTIHIETGGGALVGSSWTGEILRVRSMILNRGDAPAEFAGIELLEQREGMDPIRCDRLEETIPESSTLEVEFTFSSSNSTCGQNSGDVDVIVRVTYFIAGERFVEEANVNFWFIERRDGPDVTIDAGTLRTEPRIPMPGESYVLQVNIENIGLQKVTAVFVIIERQDMLPNGSASWEEVANKEIPSIQPAGTTSQLNLPITDTVDTSGIVRHRIELRSDSEWANRTDNNVFSHDVTFEHAEVTAKTSGPDEARPIHLAPTTEGAILFVEDGESLLSMKMSSSRTFISSPVTLEEYFAGDLAVTSTQDGFVYAAWTRYGVDEFGALTQSIVFGTFGERGEISTQIVLAGPYYLSDGRWWGLSLDERDGLFVLAGYERRAYSVGIWQVDTTIFTLHTAQPMVADAWVKTEGVISDVEILPSAPGALDVALGENSAHLLYRSKRTDGLPRLGVFYARGVLGASDWEWDHSVGDDATSLAIEVLATSPEKDEVVMGWIEGSGEGALVHIRATPDDERSDEIQVTIRSAPSASNLVIGTDAIGGVFVHDEVVNLEHRTLRGRVMHDSDDHLSIWNGTEVARGRLLSSAIDDEQTLLLLEDVNNVLEVRGIILLDLEESAIVTPTKGVLAMLSDSLISTRSVTVGSIFLLLLIVRSMSKNRTPRRSVPSSSFNPDAVLLGDDEEAVPMSDDDLKKAMVPVDLVEEELTQVAESGRIRRERRRMRARRDDDSDT